MKKNYHHRLHVAITFSLLFCIWSALMAQPDGPKPRLLPCRPSTGVGVSATASPDLGIVTPHTLVRLGTRVTLHGICKRFNTNSQCMVSSSPLRFTWSVRFYPDGMLPVDASSLLVNSSSLNPFFTPAATGKYVVTINCNEPGLFAYKDRVIIEVIRPGETWVDIGDAGPEPGGGSGYPFTGRANALFLKQGLSNLWAGTAMGGLWKYDNSQDIWFPLAEHKGLPSLAVSAMDIGPDGAIFMATGDAFPGTNVFETGQGIFRSTDGGVTWQSAGLVTSGCPTGSTGFTGLARKIVADPGHPGTIFAGTDQGVLLSTNNGDCWTSLSTTPVTDMMLDPSNNADILCAAPSSGIFRIAGAAGSSPSSTVLLNFPSGASWSVIKAAPSAPLTLYVVMSSGASQAKLFKSTNGGMTWPVVSNTVLSCSQCSYNIALAVDPKDANHVAYAGVVLQQSTDGGASFAPLPGDKGGHADIHDLSFDPNDPSELYAAMDGGVQRIRFNAAPNYAASSNWEALTNGLACSQVEEYAAAPGDPAACATGLWDNGSQFRNTGRLWQTVNGGDGFVVTVDALNPKTVFFNQNAGISGDTWRSPDNYDLGNMANALSNPFKWGEIFGIILSTKNDNKLYVAENSYSNIITPWACADPAPGDKSGIFSVEFASDKSYFASYSTGTILHFTLDESKLQFTTCALNQTAAANVETVFTTSSPAFPTMSSDPFDAGSLYGCLRFPSGGFNVLHFTRPAGSWVATDLTGDLPSSVQLTGAIQADPFFRGRIFIGDEHGLWSGTADASGNYHWVKDPDIPETRVNTIAMHRDFANSTPNLRVGTFGRGVWERIPVHYLNLCIACITNSTLHPWPQGPVPFGPAGPNKGVWISVNYRNAENKNGLTITARPIVLGKYKERFFSDTIRMDTGEASALLHLWMADQSARSGFTTDSVHIEITNRDRYVVFAKNFAMHFAWTKPGESVFHLSSLGGGPGVCEQNVQVLAKIGSGKAQLLHTPFDLVVPVNGVVDLEAPKELGKTRDKLMGWQLENRMMSRGSHLRFIVKKSQSLVLSYLHGHKED